MLGMETEGMEVCSLVTAGGPKLELLEGEDL